MVSASKRVETLNLLFGITQKSQNDSPSLKSGQHSRLDPTSPHSSHFKCRKSTWSCPPQFPSMTLSSWLINNNKNSNNKNNNLGEDLSDQLHLFLTPELSILLQFSVTSGVWINLSVREEPGSAVWDQGSSPSLYRMTDPVQPAWLAMRVDALSAIRAKNRKKERKKKGVQQWVSSLKVILELKLIFWAVIPTWKFNRQA